MERMVGTQLSSRETRVLAAIARKTLGFRKTSDRLAASQLAELTGLGRSHVVATLGRLEERGIITRDSADWNGDGTPTSINLETPWVVPKPGPLHNFTKRSPSRDLASPDLGTRRGPTVRDTQVEKDLSLVQDRSTEFVTVRRRHDEALDGLHEGRAS